MAYMSSRPRIRSSHHLYIWFFKTFPDFFFFLSFFLSKSRSFKFSAKISNLACLDENEVILQLHLSFQYNVSNSFTSSFIDI